MSQVMAEKAKKMKCGEINVNTPKITVREEIVPGYDLDQYNEFCDIHFEFV